METRKQGYTEDEVLKILRKKQDIRISGSTILMLTDTIYDDKTKSQVPNPKKIHDIGNGSWGKLDYLTKHQGYVIVKIAKFDK